MRSRSLEERMAVYEKGRASHEKEFTQDEKRFSRAEKSSQQSRGGAGLRRGEEVRAKKLRSKLSICAYTWGQNHIPSGQAELPVHVRSFDTAWPILVHVRSFKRTCQLTYTAEEADMQS